MVIFSSSAIWFCNFNTSEKYSAYLVSQFILYVKLNMLDYLHVDVNCALFHLHVEFCTNIRGKLIAVTFGLSLVFAHVNIQHITGMNFVHREMPVY